jgi:HNH endonuclease
MRCPPNRSTLKSQYLMAYIPIRDSLANSSATASRHRPAAGAGRAQPTRTATPSSAWESRCAAVHQVMWEIHNGRRIPPGHQPDHTCRLTSCINPSHLELVTCGDNKKRAWLYQKRASHCPKGHAMRPENTYRRPGRKFRECRKCERISRAGRSTRSGSSVKA